MANRIAEDRAVTYRNDAQGQQLNYRVVSETVSAFRATAPVSRDWKQAIEADFQARKAAR